MTGETGTGKGIVEAIHHNNPRRAQRFVASIAVRFRKRCSSSNSSDMFAALHGAIGNRQGRLEQAHRDLFLDEVGTMSPGLQVKLLRVLQDREFSLATPATKVDVRVIAATSNDLRRW